MGWIGGAQPAGEPDPPGSPRWHSAQLYLKWWNRNHLKRVDPVNQEHFRDVLWSKAADYSSISMMDLEDFHDLLFAFVWNERL